MRKVAFGLGANLGDPRTQVAAAAQELWQRLEGARVSSLYRTAPVGGPKQPDFLNAVVVGRSAHDVPVLKGWIEELEANAQRLREERWGPRTLDIDLLLWGHDAYERNGFIVPHPRWKERAFVLAPLSEVAPEWIDPHSKSTVKQIWERLSVGGLAEGVSMDSSDWLEALSC